MKCLIKVLFVFSFFIMSISSSANSRITELEPTEAIFYYSKVVVTGEIVGIKSIPPYLRSLNSEYLFNIQLLVKKVFKGDSSLKQKIINFDAYLTNSGFKDYSPKKNLTLAFIDIDKDNKAVPLDYRLTASAVTLSNIRQEILDNKINYSQVRIPTVSHLFSLPSALIYHSPLIILGYQTKEYTLESKTHWYAFYPDNPPDGYIVKELYVERVVRGDKKLEGKTVNFVQPFHNDHGGSFSVSAFFVAPGQRFLFGMRDITMINSQIDEYYPGAEGYNVFHTQCSLFSEAEEPLIKLFLEEAKSSSFAVPAKPKPFYPK